MNGGKEVSKTLLWTWYFFVCLFGTNLLHCFGSLLQEGKIKLSNKKTLKFIKNVDVIVDKIFENDENEEWCDRWKLLLTNYNAAMELVRKRGEYTDEEIERFQDHIDVFFVECMKETGV